MPCWKEEDYQRLLRNAQGRLEDKESDDEVTGGHNDEIVEAKGAKKARRDASGTTAAEETVVTINSSSDEAEEDPPEELPEEPLEEDVERGRATGELPTIMGQKVPSYPFCLLCLRAPRSIEASPRLCFAAFASSRTTFL